MAIIGFGRLGHVGVQIAIAMGVSTTVNNNMEQQMDDTLQMGAAGFRTTKDPRMFGELASSFDLMISTVPAGHELDIHLDLMTQDGTSVNPGVTEKPLSVEPSSVLTNRRSIADSMSDDTPETQDDDTPGTQDMVDFCARPRIGAQDEIIEAGYVDEAFGRLVASGVRYRPDIDTSSRAGERSPESRPT